MWFFIAVIGMVVAYVSGRKWGIQLYNYYRPRLHYILPYIRRKVRPMVGNTLPSITTVVDDIDAKKKFDLESVMRTTVLYHSIQFILYFFGKFFLFLQRKEKENRVVCLCVNKWEWEKIIQQYNYILTCNYNYFNFWKVLNFIWNIQIERKKLE